MIAVFDENVIWGVGANLELAVADAAKMIEVPDDLDIVTGQRVEGILAAECSDALAAMVEAKGGDIAWGWVDGVMVTEAEEDASI